MKLEAIQNHIVFKFIDSITLGGEFDRAESHGGITLLKSVDDSASQPRWGTIVSLGPDCNDELRAPGCEILIDNLKWTAGVDTGEGKVWRTDDSHVLVYRVPDENDSCSFD